MEWCKRMWTRSLLLREMIRSGSTNLKTCQEASVSFQGATSLLFSTAVENIWPLLVRFLEVKNLIQSQKNSSTPKRTISSSMGALPIWECQPTPLLLEAFLIFSWSVKRATEQFWSLISSRNCQLTGLTEWEVSTLKSLSLSCYSAPTLRKIKCRKWYSH